MRIRRGPATVTGEVRRTRPPKRAQATGSQREPGRRGGIGPEARRPAPTASPHRPSWKGVGHSCIAPTRVARRGSPDDRRGSVLLARARSRSHSPRPARGTLPPPPTRPRPARPSRCASRARTATLLPATIVGLHSGTVDKDGVTADSCSGLSAAGALELATHGRWVGTWSKSLKGYFVSAIDGVVASRAPVPSTGPSGSTTRRRRRGSADLDPSPARRILFFPDCYGKSCPKRPACSGSPRPPARTGPPFSVTVTAYADSNGKPSPAAGATVSGGGDERDDGLRRHRAPDRRARRPRHAEGLQAARDTDRGDRLRRERGHGGLRVSVTP